MVKYRIVPYAVGGEDEVQLPAGLQRTIESLEEINQGERIFDGHFQVMSVEDGVLYIREVEVAVVSDVRYPPPIGP